MYEPTHASFFSGAGGLDLGFERAGWRTVSFSEIDPYACAILAQRWPEIPNLGDITDLSDKQEYPNNWQQAFLWTGGFPCQDLSIAGKRVGLTGERSGLAFTFLSLVERHRPFAILLENVQGLLSSNQGRDMGALTDRLGKIGYGWAFRIFDARHFGVPQRRRRVFIFALRSGPDDSDGRIAAERAAAVLAVGTRCPRHPKTRNQTRKDSSARSVVGALDTSLGHHGGAWGDQAVAAGHVISQAVDSGGMRTLDGMAGWMDGGGELAATLNSGGNNGGFRTEPGEHLVVAFMPARTVGKDNDIIERFAPRNIVDALHGRTGNKDPLLVGNFSQHEDILLPIGLDSNRYRMCGNGVVTPVAEWIGRRILTILKEL